MAFPAHSLQLAAPVSSPLCTEAGGMVCRGGFRPHLKAGYSRICRPDGGAARCVLDTTQARGSDPGVNLGSVTQLCLPWGPSLNCDETEFLFYAEPGLEPTFQSLCECPLENTRPPLARVGCMWVKPTKVKER